MNMFSRVVGLAIVCIPAIVGVSHSAKAYRNPSPPYAAPPTGYLTVGICNNCSIGIHAPLLLSSTPISYMLPDNHAEVEDGPGNNSLQSDVAKVVSQDVATFTIGGSCTPSQMGLTGSWQDQKTTIAEIDDTVTVNHECTCSAAHAWINHIKTNFNYGCNCQNTSSLHLWYCGCTSTWSGWKDQVTGADSHALPCTPPTGCKG